MSYDLQISDGDFVIDNQGDVIVVQDYDKLYQDLWRLMLTSPGSNTFDNQEGFGVIDLLGKSIPKDLNELVISKSIYNGTRHMIQQQSVQALIQYLSAYEQIATISAIVFQKLTLSQISFDIGVTTVRGLQVAFSFTVK